MYTVLDEISQNWKRMKGTNKSVNFFNVDSTFGGWRSYQSKTEDQSCDVRERRERGKERRKETYRKVFLRLVRENGKMNRVSGEGNFNGGDLEVFQVPKNIVTLSQVHPKYLVSLTDSPLTVLTSRPRVSFRLRRGILGLRVTTVQKTEILFVLQV